MMARTLATLGLLLTPLAVSAQQDMPRATAPLVSVKYPVADLVVAVPGLDHPELTGRLTKESGAVGVSVPAFLGSMRITKEDWLIKKITATIARDSWQSAGGPGTIRYLPGE